MERNMLTAKIMQEQGMTQREISLHLGVSDRTIRNYLKTNIASRKRKKRTSKLDPYKEIVGSIIAGDPHYNCELLFEKLISLGYAGKISILRDYVFEVRKRVLTDAVIRFETIPGLQAQVDWKEFGVQNIDGNKMKLYAFVMVLGYSRTPFVCFTTSMRSEVLLRCHLEAFRFLGGVPHEILYDNMKTVFVSDASGEFKVNRDMLSFAAHYGFTPKRCRVRRPQTKGKVERTIGFVEANFWPRVKDMDLSLNDLNVKALEWIESIMDKRIGGLNDSRRERFIADKSTLRELPEFDLDIRRSVICTVTRESCVVFETNKYSIHPDFIGQNVCMRVDERSRTAEIFNGANSLRTVELLPPGSRRTLMNAGDYSEIMKRHDADRRKRMRFVERKIKRKQAAEVEVRHPSFYEAVFGGVQ